MKKKSYNPFKMWGSYVGMILYPVLLTIIEEFLKKDWVYLKIISFPTYLFFLLAKTITGCRNDECWGIGMASMFAGSLFVGFLVGWGIHSLIRKFILNKK